MTPFPHAVDTRAPLAEARLFMRRESIHHLPVMSDGELSGIITDRDIKLYLGPDFAYPSEDEVSVGEVCISDPYVVDLNTPLPPVLDEMSARHIGSAIVVRRGKLAGIFTAADACRAYAELLRELHPSGGDEAA